jgi:hypothetical protein
VAWSWSHSEQAYADAETNLRALSKETLEVIYAEWRAAQGKHGVIDTIDPAFNERKYARALKHAKTLEDDTLANFVWARAEELATCDNGGFDAWLCPYGCGPHCVPFHIPNHLEDDDAAGVAEDLLDPLAAE